jgi:ATP-dependent Clp protease ATP-binding subunit ClpC
MANPENKEFVVNENGLPGIWYRQRFLYFDKDLRSPLIHLRRLRLSVSKVLYNLALVLGISGVVSLGFFLFPHYQLFISEPRLLFSFWLDRQPLLAFFYFSLFFWMFIIYRNSEKRASLQRFSWEYFAAEIKRPTKYEISGALSEEAWRFLEDAYLLASSLGRKQASVIDLFRVLLKDRTIQNVLVRLSVPAEPLIKMLDRALEKSKIQEGRQGLRMSSKLEESLLRAFIEACNDKRRSVDVLDIFFCACRSDQMLSEILYELEIDSDKIANAVIWFRINDRLLEASRRYSRLAILKPKGGMNRAYTAIATPTLDHFSRDLTLMARAGFLSICVARSKELEEIFDSFVGGHNGLLLVGQRGVGKNTIIGGLAQLMVEEAVPEFLKDKRLVEIDFHSLVSGADPSEAQARLLNYLNEAASSGNIVLYINNVENLIGISAGGQESLDLSEVLAEAVSRHRIFCLASATGENYSRFIEKRALGSAFTTIGIEEPEKNAAIQMLESKVASLEGRYGIYVTYNAIEQAVVMSDKYLHENSLPAKAIDLLDKAAALSAKEFQNDPQKMICGREQVAMAISESTGIPVNKISVSEKQKLLSLETEIHKRLIGQEEAVAAVSASLRRARAEMKDGKKPIASFLFLGPTGVGKTELAKSVADVYFGDEDCLIRLDMSEYQNQESVGKMIGSEGEPGYLTEAVRKKPFSLILLDEVEKAHPDVLNLFLQLLDDGRLTDGQGRTISFSESIIIATSNIGAIYIQDQIKAGTDIQIIRQEIIDNQLNKYMRPELINRFDGIIVFKPLSEENVVSIATLMLKKIKKNLAEKGVGLKADKDGVRLLAHDGYDPKFGARPLRRLLQDRIENDIANRILSEELKRRDTVVINNRGQIEIEKAASLLD